MEELDDVDDVHAKLGDAKDIENYLLNCSKQRKQCVILRDADSLTIAIIPTYWGEGVGYPGNCSQQRFASS